VRFEVLDDVVRVATGDVEGNDPALLGPLVFDRDSWNVSKQSAQLGGEVDRASGDCVDTEFVEVRKGGKQSGLAGKVDLKWLEATGVGRKRDVERVGPGRPAAIEAQPIASTSSRS